MTTSIVVLRSGDTTIGLEGPIDRKKMKVTSFCSRGGEDGDNVFKDPFRF